MQTLSIFAGIVASNVRTQNQKVKPKKGVAALCAATPFLGFKAFRCIKIYFC
ncbi:hypothetical protein APA_1957 [Pseudanabaena sp. lw0831]|nr:hypothetical protein APA_1957 [Pseudanabaena sp. lw0831]